MATINRNYNKLNGHYLFSEISKQAKAFSKANPKVEIMRLGVGNTTEALTPTVIEGMKKGVDRLASLETYTGYGDEQGNTRLRHALSSCYKRRKISIDPLEIFISDGAKSDCANILSIFGEKNIVCVQDPVYPVYVDSSIISGKKIVFIKGNEENGFVPKPPKVKVDLIYIASPNNPTGAVFTKKQLKEFVDFAISKRAVIIFDAAYCEYIKDSALPKSIYEIKGAKTCAIEINSFSKWAGFTGVRLGWTVVPMDLVVEGAEKGKVNSLWNRRQTTMFNGASNIAQEGGLAVLTDKGQKECRKVIAYYMENAKVIREGLKSMGLKVYGGENAPYLWVKCPKGINSWDFFEQILNQAHVVTTPGAGFGKMGEGYIRLSAFGHKGDIERAVRSIRENLKI